MGGPVDGAFRLIRPLLPNEPRVVDEEAEQALTERFLSPALTALEALFRLVRAQVDPGLRQAGQRKNGKAYPLGWCLEISLAVQNSLQRLQPASLPPLPAQGYAALAAFLAHGGRFRQVWGDLRGEYFQNAFLAGTLYIDASNDTVVPTKPPVEILPLAQARFVPIEDFGHFGRVASRYWGAQVFPNHVLPSLAPYFPLVTVTAEGAVCLQSATDYMIALTCSAGFRPSEDVLEAAPMDGDLAGRLAQCLARVPAIGVVADPARGRALALEQCRQLRVQGASPSDEHRTTACRTMLAANQALDGLGAGLT